MTQNETETANSDFREQMIRDNRALYLALRALQDALVCLDGKRFELGDKIYDSEPYALQKKAVKMILEL